LTTFKSAAEGNLIRVFEVATHGEAASEAGDFEVEGGQAALEVEGGGVAFEGGVGGDDDFAEAAFVYPAHQFGDFEVVGADAFDGGDSAVQDVVAAVIGPRPFDGDYVERFFDDAEKGGVAAVVQAKRARVGFGDIEAVRAKLGLGFEFLQGDGEVEGEVIGRAEEVEGEARGRLGADAGQAGEFVN
jgi:hypothetical protein